ncbi:MAG: penicillin-binding protein, partial [Nocardioides sp.]|nr:penicillin-binding protein [Nocardioides sp.]
VKAYANDDFSKVAFADTKAATVDKDYKRIAGDLLSRFGAPKVTATSPTFTGDGDADSGESKLTWTWNLPTAKWTYGTVVHLVKKDDHWRFVWDARSVWPKLTQDETLSATMVDQQRGDIMSTSGATLVGPRPVVSVGIDKVKVPPKQAATSARRLGKLMHINAKKFVKRVNAAGDKAFVEAIAVRKESMTKAEAAKVRKIRGAEMLNESLPLAPSKTFAAPILGTVGAVTAELMQKNPGTYSDGELAGLSGLQQRYDTQLRGRPGVNINVLDANGGVVQKLYQADPVDGQTLRITLDESLQAGAEKLLEQIKPASALVAIRPSDGAVLAAANGPGTHGINLATFGKAAPGSTFKTATSLALIRKGMGPGSEVSCPKHFDVDGKKFSNDSWYPKSALGTVTLSEAVAQSCNTAMVGQSAKVSDQDLSEAAASLGFGVDRSAGFPAYFGSVPAASGSKTEHAADMIGQGKVLASPLSMATAIASIQAGKTVVPQLVQGQQATATGIKPLTTQEAAQLRTIFRQVVTSGTGRGLKSIPGGPVIAKTGTAEFDKKGKRLTHTWMIAAQDDLAVAVYVDEGTTGSATAGPIVESFLRLAREK